MLLQPTALPVRADSSTRARATAARATTEINVERRDDEVHFAIEDRRYRVRGLEKNHSGQQLRVNILAALASRDDLVHMDTVDLCQARCRAAFVKATAAELFVEEGTIKRDVGRMLLELEQLQQERIEAAMAARPVKVELSEAERIEALALLEDPDLIQRIWLCWRIPTSASASWPTTRPVAWWASRATSWSATWPASRGV
jgi:hypothetical protein